MKKICIVMVLFALLAGTVSTVSAAKVVLLKEIDRPDTLSVDKDNSSMYMIKLVINFIP